MVFDERARNVSAAAKKPFVFWREFDSSSFSSRCTSYCCCGHLTADLFGLLVLPKKNEEAAFESPYGN